MNTDHCNPFRLHLKNRFMAAVVERFLGLTPLASAYDRRPEDLAPSQFLKYTLNALRVRLRIRSVDQKLEEIPPSGPLLIVANHPLGGLEGVALAHMLIQRRPDLRVLTNEFLIKIPELRDIFIGVDVLSDEAASSNGRGIRVASKHLQQGGALLIFPAGMVSALNLKKRQIEDRPWNRLAGSLARRHKAICLPVYVSGRNSKLFYLLGLIHPRLRTIMLARELSNKQNQQLTLTFGLPIPPEEMRHLDSPQSITHYLRICTEILSRRGSSVAPEPSPPQPVPAVPAVQSRDEIRRAIAGL